MTKSNKPKEPTGYIWAVKSSIKRAPKWMPDEVAVITDGETKGRLLIYCGWTLTVGGANKAWPISRLKANLGRIHEEWAEEFGKSWKLEIRSTVKA